MKNVLVGLGWDARSTDGQDFDLDASAFLLAANGKVRGDADFIFYNNLKSADGSVTHTGDNRTGEGDGDDESSKSNWTRYRDVDKIIFVVTIHDAQARRQSFGQVSGAFIRLVNDDNQTEVARYDLTEDATETAMLFGSCIVTTENGNSVRLAVVMLVDWLPCALSTASTRPDKSNFLTQIIRGDAPDIHDPISTISRSKNGCFSR